MSTSVWPSLPVHELRKEEDDSTERELSWLLESLQETLASLKTGLEDCYALLAPVEPGSTLVMSSPRSEYLKGHITRVGTQVVKGYPHRGQARPQRSLSPRIPHTNPASLNWAHNPVDPDTFAPSLPSNVSLDLTISDGSLLLTIRVLEPVAQQVNFGSRIAFAIGAQRRLEHDEMDEVFMFKGEEVRVKEKVRVESADPRLMSVLAKVAALEHTVEGARAGLKIVMGSDGLEAED
ncbi:37S ribosomal protein Rsm22 [Botrytis cinerea]